MDVSIIVATFGSEEWAELARLRAIPSAYDAGPAELVVTHGATLADARNAGADLTSGEWLLFLDADDELEPGYLDAMSSATGDLRAPAVRYVSAGDPDPPPISFSDRDMARMNPCAIGTLLTRYTFESAGGFWPEPLWEDWSLFRRAWLLGATIEHVPKAIYRANLSPAGRNSSRLSQSDRNRMHRNILRSHTEWLRKQDPK